MKPSAMVQKRLITEPEAKVRMTSSARRGKMRAPAKGHPTIEPRPNQMMPCAVRWAFFQSRKAAKPSIDIYMVKVDGRNAVDAWNIPGLSVTTITNNNPMRGLRVRQIAEYNRVWQAAHTNARPRRIV
jgi:hypothetical protein